MRPAFRQAAGSTPLFIDEATRLAGYIAGFDRDVVKNAMGVSSKLADATLATMAAWRPGGTKAIDTFLGDIYSGLQAASLDEPDRSYANESLFILSGLYGILRPLDAVMPYRLEMAYKLPDKPYDNLYSFWGDKIASSLPEGRTIINTSSAEYTKAVFPFLHNARVITPKFLSISPKSGEPVFVTVHAKIARGAFARWLITKRVESESELANFADLGYAYDATLSSEFEPVYVAISFQGIGLSVRLK